MFSAAILLVSTAFASPPSGDFQGASWSINQQRALIWNGQPYIPVGWRLPAIPEAIRTASETGVNDLLLEMPLGTEWTHLVAAAEQAEVRYLVTPDADAPKAPAFLVQPEVYRIDRVPARGLFRVPLQNARSAYYLLITSKGFFIEDKGWVDVIGGFVTIEVSQRVVAEAYTLLIYPRVDASGLNDYWELFDQRRDAVLSRLQTAQFGPGLRGVVSPTGRVDRYTAYEGGIVPDSELFRLEFQAYLEEKYRGNIDALVRGWRLRAPEIDTFPEAARMVPLFSRTRGVDKLWDPQEGRHVSVDIFNTAYWTDLQTVIDNAAVRRLSRFAQAVRRVVNVPVIYEWSGWSPVYDTRDAAGNGIGVRAYGTGLSVIEDFAARAVSSAVAWNNPGWLIATELRGSAGQDPYPDQRALTGVVSDLAELGVKGWFVRWTGGPEAAWLGSIVAAVRADTSIPARALRAAFYPENARYPANTMRLPGGVWWLPTPAAGNRIDLGPGYEAYRHNAPYATFTAIWRADEPKKTKLLFNDPSKLTFLTADGRPVDVRVLRDGVELTLDTVPILIYGAEDVPVPQDTVDAIQAEYKAITASPSGRVLGTGDYRFLFEDAVKRLRQNPSGAYLSMLDSIRKIQQVVGVFEWIEGESVEETTFGHVYSSPACSGERALGVDTPFAPGPDGYTATYTVRLDEGEREFWIAARIDADVLPFVEVEFGGAKHELSAVGTGGYGPGFAWYSLGKVVPKPGAYKIVVRLRHGAPRYSMSIDALLLTKKPFRPSGPRMPSVF